MTERKAVMPTAYLAITPIQSSAHDPKPSTG